MSLMQNRSSRPSYPNHHIYMQIIQPSKVTVSCVNPPHSKLTATRSHIDPISSSTK
jgi:hypothetical protein